VRGEGALGGQRSGERVVGAGEGVEEGVSLGVDLDPGVGREGVAQQAAMGREGVFVGCAERVSRRVEPSMSVKTKVTVSPGAAQSCAVSAI
jgi:hypothetical protein